MISRRTKMILALAAIFSLKALPVFGIEDPPKKQVVRAETLRPEKLAKLLIFPAKVASKVDAALTAELDGIIGKILTPLGTKVSAGQTLMVLHNPNPLFKYAPLEVKSPVAGIISSVRVTEGSRVTLGSPLLSLTDPSQIRILIEVPAADLRHIHASMLGELRSSDIPKPLAVRIAGISPAVDGGTGTATVQVELAHARQQEELKPGMLAQTTFETNIHKGIVIPDQAVVYRGKDTFARLIEKGRMRLVKIELGNSQSGQTEITSGLHEGDRIVTRSSGFIAENEEVEESSEHQEKP